MSNALEKTLSHFVIFQTFFEVSDCEAVKMKKNVRTHELFSVASPNKLGFTRASSPFFLFFGAALVALLRVNGRNGGKVWREERQVKIA